MRQEYIIDLNAVQFWPLVVENHPGPNLQCWVHRASRGNFAETKALDGFIPDKGCCI